MTRMQLNQCEMFHTVSSFVGRHRPIWAGTKAVQDAVTELEELDRLIMEKIRLQQTPTTGAAGEKGKVQDQLKEWILDVACLLCAYGSKTGDNELVAQSELTITVLDRMSMDTLESAGKRFLGLATENLAGLADFGITASEVASMEAVLEQFKALKTLPRTVVAERSMSTFTMPALIRKTSRLLRGRLDKQMIHFRSAHPDFHAGYLTARAIVARGGSVTKATTTTPTVATIADPKPQA